MNDATWPENAPTRDVFIELVWSEGRRHYRDLPWRGIDNPYAVMVSEVMLQQTQVSRVLSYWPRFMEAFPTLDALASASVSDVLQFWQGLGYNRRAIALHKAACECSERFGGKMPETYEGLLALPGVGPATAGGVTAFAYRKPAVYLETNVRSVFIHELFPDRDGVSDKELIPLIEATVSAEDPRGWYYALLDYGAHLKSAVANPSRRSSSYTRQSKFEGSRRQKRAWIVRRVLDAEDAGMDPAALKRELDVAERKDGREALDDALFDSIVADLAKEGFFRIVDGRIRS